MIVMISNHCLDEAESELGVPCEQIFTPESRHQAKRPEAMFCIDNGAYSNWEPQSFQSLLARELPRVKLCRFVAVPDVVGSARRTLECFENWKDDLKAWPLAYVCQDGQEDSPIPWGDIDALFIGGTTSWKLSVAAAQCIQAANVIGKWVHVGRVNTPARFEYFEKLGADSIDGTGLSRYSHMREAIYLNATEPRLPL